MKKKSTTSSTKTKEGFKSVQDNYTVEIKYSPKAIKDKLVKFTTKNGDSFEISSDKLIELLAQGVNKNKLAPVYVDTENIDMVYVKRQLVGTATKTINKGEEIRIDYSHPYPLEFAILEEGYKIAVIDESVPKLTITPKYLEQVKDKIKPQTEDFLKSSYRAIMPTLETKT